MRNNTRSVLRTDMNVSEVAHGIERWLSNDKYLATRLFHLESGAYEICARHRRGDVAKLFGLDIGVCVRIEPAGKGCVLFTAGGGAWRDKLIVGAISLVALWPLVLSAGYGACRQGIILTEVKWKINSYSGY